MLHGIDEAARFYGATDINHGQMGTWIEFLDTHDAKLFRKWARNEEPWYKITWYRRDPQHVVIKLW